MTGGRFWALTTASQGLVVMLYNMHRPCGVCLLQVASSRFPITFLPKDSRTTERDKRERKRTEKNKLSCPLTMFSLQIPGSSAEQSPSC